MKHRENKSFSCWILFFCFSFFFFSCDRNPVKNKEENQEEKIVEKTIAEEKKQSSSVVSMEQKIQDAGINIQEAYRIVLYCSFLDTPHHRMLGYTLQCKLADFLGKESKFFSIQFSQEKHLAQAILQAKDLKEDLGSAFFEKNKGQEIALAVCVSLAEKKIQMRSLHFLNGRISPSLSLDFISSSHAIELLCQNFFILLGLEGYIIESEGKKVTIAFRNFQGNQKAKIDPGSYFWVFNQERLWPDSLVRIDRIVEGNILSGSGEFIGSRPPQNGLKIRKICFPGGTQKFQLVNIRGEAQPGFSIFVHHEFFSNNLEHYLGTTDSSGEFFLKDNHRKPLYLLIAKNIEGIYFDFMRKLLVVQPCETVEKISVQDWQPLKENAKKILSEETKTEKNEALRTLINMRLEQVKEYIASRELNKALLALKLARQHSQEMEGEGKAALHKMLEEVEKIYEEALFKTKVKEEYISACKLVEEADSCIAKIEYEKARTSLLQAEKTWPKGFYEQEYKDLQDRKKRLDILQKQLSEDVGKARAFIANNLFVLNPEDINSIVLKRIQEHIKILSEKGNMDKNARYSDYELWLKLRIFLNELSQKLAQLAQKYLGSYQKASTEHEKSMFFEKHKELYEASKTIDSWLQTFQNN